MAGRTRSDTFTTDADRDHALQDALTAYRTAWRAKVGEVNAAIAASAERQRGHAGAQPGGRVLMNRREFGQLKAAGGLRLTHCEFKESRRARLPKHMARVRRQRVFATDLIEIGQGLSAVFLRRSGDCLEKRALYAYAFRDHPDGLEPLLRMDYHPSHKGLHVKFNCENAVELVNRDVVQGREFGLRTAGYDPDDELDRARFVEEFCRRIAVPLGQGDLL